MLRLGDSIQIFDLNMTLLYELDDKHWIALMDDNKLFKAEKRFINKISATHEYNEQLLTEARFWADRDDNGKLTRFEICEEMIEAMNNPEIKHWMSQDDILWEWDLDRQDFLRNGVYFAMRIMTPCGRWI